jgi:hypothetical protein
MKYMKKKKKKKKKLIAEKKKRTTFSIILMQGLNFLATKYNNAKSIKGLGIVNTFVDEIVNRQKAW